MSGISESAMNMGNFAGGNTLASLGQNLQALFGAFGKKDANGNPVPTASQTAVK
jgi:hypothetical protein